MKHDCKGEFGRRAKPGRNRAKRGLLKYIKRCKNNKLCYNKAMKESVIHDLLFVNATCVKHGILPGQMATLCALFREGEVEASMLMKLTGMKKSNMHRVLNYLLEKGEAEYKTQRESYGGEVRKWRLTTEGKQHVMQCEREYRQHVQDMQNRSELHLVK